MKSSEEAGARSVPAGMLSIPVNLDYSRETLGMTADPTGSEFRFEKRRAAAIITLVGGETVHGSFFTAAADTRHEGGERIGDLLNADTGFFPFELEAPHPHTVLLNRAHVITV